MLRGDIKAGGRKGWHKKNEDGLAGETEAGWRFSGLKSQMQSESKVFSSSISAQRGGALTPASKLFT